LFERTLETTLERARKAEKLADEIAVKLKKLHVLKYQGRA
jgi:DNA-binding Xre family transcriptional regulator